MTCGTSYKFTLLKHYINRSSLGIGNKYFFGNPIAIRLVKLERGLGGLLQAEILELKYLKLQSYSHLKIELLKSRKIKTRKFDGKDPINWILQMEKYFDLHGVPLLQKVRITSNYLEPNHFYGIKGFVLINHLSCGQFSRRK